MISGGEWIPAVFFLFDCMGECARVLLCSKFGSEDVKGVWRMVFFSLSLSQGLGVLAGSFLSAMAFCFSQAGTDIGNGKLVGGYYIILLAGFL